MSKYVIEHHNLDGCGAKRTRVYAIPSSSEDFWNSVTDIPCPSCAQGMIRWAEAGYVPGYRICDRCGKHFIASGTASAPKLLRVGQRVTKPEHD